MIYVICVCYIVYIYIYYAPVTPLRSVFQTLFEVFPGTRMCLEDKIFPKQARKLNCMEICNTCFNEAQPSSQFSCMMFFLKNILLLQNNCLEDKVFP